MTNEERLQEAIASQEIGVTPTSEAAFGLRAKKFDSLVGEYTALSESIKQLEEEKKTVQTRLQQYFIDSDIKSVVGADGAKVTLVQNQGRPTIDKVRLIEAGVPASTIESCTVWGKPFQFVKVTPPKG